MIETGQRRLSNWLVRHLGTPEKFKSGPVAEKAIKARRGIASFFSIYGDANPQGHIVIVSIDRWGSYIRCYWSPREVWFWQLNQATQVPTWPIANPLL